MKKTSMIKFEDISHELNESQLGVLLLESDISSVFDRLSSHSSYKDKHVSSTDKSTTVYRLFPLLYSNGNNQVCENLAQVRDNAHQNLFERWTLSGYNAKRETNRYQSTAFTDFLTEIDFLNADYMLLAVE